MKFHHSLVLLLGTIISLSTAMAPPRFSGYENVHQYRANRNITFNYHPENIHPELCRHLTEDECRRRDQEATTANPNEGNIKSLVLLVRFANHKNRDLPSKEYVDSLLNGGGMYPEINKVGSVKEYLQRASLGKYNVDFVVTDWFDLPETEEYYARNPDNGAVDSGRFCQKAYLFKPALDYWIQQIDFEQFDQYGDPVNGWDGGLDSLVIIHSGQDAAYGESYPYQGDWCSPMDYTKRQWSLGCAGTPVTSGGGNWINGFYTLGGWGMASAYSDCKGNYLTMGIVTHEIMHSLGLIDLYDMDPNPFPDGSWYFPGGVGLYDIMGDPGGWNYDGAFPGSLSGYSRMKAGWLDPIPINKDGFYAVQAAQFSTQVYIITKCFPDGEYLLIENRQPAKWERDWPTGGYLIFRVDENVAGQYDRDKFRVRVEQADGRFDLEAGMPQDTNDLWSLGMTYGPGGAKPNSDSNNGTRTGISITFIHSPGFIGAFRVEGLESCGGGGYGGFSPSKREQIISNEASQVNTTDEKSYMPPRPQNNMRNISIAGSGSSVEDGSDVGETMRWVLSMLGGLGVLMGVALVLM